MLAWCLGLTSCWLIQPTISLMIFRCVTKQSLRELGLQIRRGSSSTDPVGCLGALTEIWLPGSRGLAWTWPLCRPLSFGHWEPSLHQPTLNGVAPNVEELEMSVAAIVVVIIHSCPPSFR